MQTAEMNEKQGNKKKQSKIDYREVALGVTKFAAIAVAQGILTSAGARLFQVASQRSSRVGEVLPMNRSKIV